MKEHRLAFERSEVQRRFRRLDRMAGMSLLQALGKQ
jgi:hypothetical protein